MNRKYPAEFTAECGKEMELYGTSAIFSKGDKR